jgi:hypothetical protein
MIVIALGIALESLPAMAQITSPSKSAGDLQSSVATKVLRVAVPTR